MVAVVAVGLDPLADRVHDPVESGLRGCNQLSHVPDPYPVGRI